MSDRQQQSGDGTREEPVIGGYGDPGEAEALVGESASEAGDDDGRLPEANPRGDEPQKPHDA